MHAHVQYLEQKVTELLAGYREQQELIQQLSDKNERLMQQMTSKAETRNTLLGNLTTSTIVKQETKQKDWEAMLDDYIKGIEKSIVYLEKIQ